MVRAPCSYPCSAAHFPTPLLPPHSTQLSGMGVPDSNGYRTPKNGECEAARDRRWAQPSRKAVPGWISNTSFPNDMTKGTTYRNYGKGQAYFQISSSSLLFRITKMLDNRLARIFQQNERIGSKTDVKGEKNPKLQRKKNDRN